MEDIRLPGGRGGQAEQLHEVAELGLVERRGVHPVRVGNEMADDGQVFRAAGVDEELVFRTEDNEPLRAAVLSAFHGGSRPFIAPALSGTAPGSPLPKQPMTVDCHVQQERSEAERDLNLAGEPGRVDDGRDVVFDEVTLVAAPAPELPGTSSPAVSAGRTRRETRSASPRRWPADVAI